MTNQKVSLIPREILEGNYPIARFLSESEQSTYKEAIQQYSEKATETLNIGRKGSNLFKVLLLNQIGIRTATLPELDSALENGLDLEGFYEDAPSVVLRSAGDTYKPNDYLAKDLAEQLSIETFEEPVIVNGLEIKADGKSDYGLSFVTSDKTQVIVAPDFNHKNPSKTFSRINPDYSIEFDDKSSRTLWTRNNGISRLYLGRDSVLGSGVEYLAGSYDYGRVVLVSGEGTEATNEKS